MSADDNKMFSGTSFDVDPCSYNPNHKIKFKNIAYSMGQKTGLSKNNENPGPGAYNSLLKLGTSPLYS